MSQPILDGTNLDSSVIVYSTLKPHASGSKFVNVLNKHTKEALTISTPLMLTWGAQEGKAPDGSMTGKWTMSLQFPNVDYSTPDQEAFLRSMRAVEARIKADAIVHSKEWFGKIITSAEVIDEKFSVMLRHPKKEKGGLEHDESKPPTMSIKLPCWKNVWQPEIYDQDMAPLFVKGNTRNTPLEFLKPMSHVMCLIQSGGIWFVNGKLSIVWNLKQCVVQKPREPTISSGTCFLKITPADKEKLKTLTPVEDMDVDDGAISSTIVDDDDEDIRVTVSLPELLPRQPAPVEVVVETEATAAATAAVAPAPAPAATASDAGDVKKAAKRVLVPKPKAAAAASVV